MTDNDIRNYIEGLEEPIFLKDVVSELTSKDPTISWKRVTRLMREMGYENRLCKNALNPKGKGSVWTRVNAVPTCGDDDDDDDVDDYVDEVDEDAVYGAENTEDTKAKTRSTADVLHDVDAQNASNAELSKRLLASLNRSRSLKEELMRRQQEALLEFARRILGLYGSEKERREYGGF